MADKPFLALGLKPSTAQKYPTFNPKLLPGSSTSFRPGVGIWFSWETSRQGFGLNVILDEIAKEPEFSHRVIWAGGMSDEHLCYLYSGCEAFLFPSTLEGFGLPALEAMKCGAPVICSNTSSLPEVAGDAAIMIDPKDEAALANAIVEVVSNPARQRELAAQSLRRAASFSWKASADKVAEAYELAVNSGRLQSAR